VNVNLQLEVMTSESVASCWSCKHDRHFA